MVDMAVSVEAEPAPQPSSLPFSWLISSGIRGRLVMVAIVLQLVVPAIAFAREPPSRFGFQMYSGVGGAEVEARDAAGRSIEIDLSYLLAGSMRPELDWTVRLPEYVCVNVPAAATVTVRQSSRRRTLTCD